MTLEREADVLIIDPWQPRQGARIRYIADVPADKSLTHRALIFAAMAKGKSRIRNPLRSGDCLGTLAALRQLGVEVDEDPQAQGGVAQWSIQSPGITGLKNPGSGVLDLGNSGTAARLLLGMLAGIQGLKVKLTGDHSLSRRPMGRVVEPLLRMGAHIDRGESGDNLSSSPTLPLTITGSVLRATHHVAHIASAQVKSALLIAGLQADGETLVTLPDGGRDHTERMLAALGAMISSRHHNGFETVSIHGPFKLPPLEAEIPADPSSAAFFAALAVLHPGLEISCVRVLRNSRRAGFYEVLARMGVEVIWDHQGDGQEFLGESVADLVVRRRGRAALSPVDVAAGDVVTMIDEIPILSVLLAMVEGESRIFGLGELRTKESDRLAEIARLLTAAGRDVDIRGDCLVIRGGSGPCQSFEYAGDDHRLLMSAIVLATRAQGPSKIFGTAWIDTSFPLFLEGFQNINAGFMSV